jgi:hypothetical protein
VYDLQPIPEKRVLVSKEPFQFYSHFVDRQPIAFDRAVLSVIFASWSVGRQKARIAKVMAIGLTRGIMHA